MNLYEKLPKELPAPGFLDEKILRAAADFSERRQKQVRRRRFFFGGAVAAMVVASCLFFPRGGAIAPAPSDRQDFSNWSTVDQESFILSVELNSCNLWDEEFSI